MRNSVNKALLLALCLSVSASASTSLAKDKHKPNETGTQAADKHHKSKKLSKQERQQMAFLGRGRKHKDQETDQEQSPNASPDAGQKPGATGSTTGDTAAASAPAASPITATPPAEVKSVIVPVSDIKPVIAAPAETAPPIITIQDTPPKADGDLTEPSRPLPDGALISVLKDLNRAIKDSPEAAKLENPYQKAAFSIAVQALSKALDNPRLPSNRIITPGVLQQAQSYISTEAWDSGDLIVADGCHVSMNALWAKKSEGLVNLSLAGNCGGKIGLNGNKVGEFVFVLSGKSAIDKGFDIQSQQEVTFWLGKLVNFAVDAAAYPNGSNNAISSISGNSSQAGGKTTAPVLNAVLTDKTRQYQAAMKVYHKKKELLAQKAEEERKKLEAKASAEQLAASESKAKAKEQTDSQAKAKEELVAQVKAEVEARLKTEAAKIEAAKSTAAANIPPAESSTPKQSFAQSVLTSATVNAINPSTIVSPDKAVAGQYMTVAVLTSNRSADNSAVLSFNGQNIPVGPDGRARFLVPDNSLPGPSLQVSLTSSPQSAPHPVVVLQPLQTPAYPQLPRIDSVSQAVRSGGTINVDGHNFDGVADRNRVIIDGVHDAQVVVSSPVQLKADLPVDLAPGKHSISIGTGDLRSNPGQFEVIAVEVQPDAKEVERDAFTKLIVKAVGTTNPVKVRLTNKTPDVIRIAKGNDIVVTTAGGANNQVVLSVQRFAKAPYQVQAELE